MTIIQPPALVVRELGADSQPQWDAFVQACPEATFFHRAGWKEVIERSFGHRTYFLYAETAGVIRGVLPLVHMRSRLFGNALVSTAFCVYGGPAAADEPARAALEARALQLAEQLDVDHVEFRNREPAAGRWQIKPDVYATFRKAMDPDPERNMLAIPRKQRAMVRKGIGLGLRSRLDPGVDSLHHIYAVSVRNLGTPVFSKAYFRNLRAIFGSDCEVLTVTKDDQPVASVLNFYFRDEVLPYYGGGSDAARDLAANDFMYWEVMRRACARGYRIFDFGRSKFGTGAYAFKKHWGFEPTPLPYAYWLRRGETVPEINPLNPKYRTAIALWKRLPLPVAKAIGPHIVRNLG